MEPINSQDRALRIIFEAVDEVNEMLPEDRKLEKATETILAGDTGKLDSLGLVSFIVAVEGAAQRHLGQDLCLADKIDSPDSPLASIATLATYVSETAMRNEA